MHWCRVYILSQQIAELEEAAAVAALELGQWKDGLAAAAAAEAAAESAWARERSVFEEETAAQQERMRLQCAEHEAMMQQGVLPRLREAEHSASAAQVRLRLSSVYLSD